ncbi:unnamed protein product [Strongylus vulgaris]|uniref:Uncharacterized protein n=1 Tax=Strongylus vulgaris TaxID=40348 RepID=A0A3P7LUC7_STRVU|nr:unnamed protein product [Strongylus vulgaris]
MYSGINELVDLIDSPVRDIKDQSGPKLGPGCALDILRQIYTVTNGMREVWRCVVRDAEPTTIMAKTRDREVCEEIMCLRRSREGVTWR